MALLDITVKTLDGQNRSFSVPEGMTVRSFKEEISSSIEISADTQRLIFHGRVMQDDKELREYDIHGKAVHVVQRAPPSSTSSRNDGPSTQRAPPPMGARPMDGGLLDVHVHVGGMNTAATSRDARQRIQQAEINVGIINDALNLLEQRTGITAAQCPPADSEVDVSSENAEEGMETSGAPQDTATSQSSSSTPSQGPNSSTQAQESQEGLSATELADFLDRVLVTSQRIAPQIRLYRNYLRNEENYTASSQSGRHAQEVANRVMEAIHAMSHVMHNLSDVMVDMHSTTPRQATATPLSPFTMAGTNTMAIPIHMNVRARPVDPNAADGNRGRAPASAQQQAGAGNAPETTSSEEAAPPPSANVDEIRVDESVVTIHNVHSEMEVEIDGHPANPTISIVSASTQNNPASSTANTTSSTSTSTSSTGSSTTRTSTGTNATGTAGFTVGPTTNINIGGSPMGAIPNVPGLPQGMLQNIVQSILSNPGVTPGEQVQVDLIHPTVMAGFHIHQQPPRPQGQSASRTSSSQATPTTTTNTSGNAATASSTFAGQNPGLSSRSTNTPRPIFINRTGRPTPYPLGPRQAHPRPTGATPRLGNGGQHGRGFVDMHLPCQSHHYSSQTARQAARSSRGQGQHQVPNLSTMVSGMVGDLIGQVGQAHQNFRSGASQTAPASGATATTSSSSTTPSSTGAGHRSGGGPANAGGPHPMQPPPFNPMQIMAGMMGGSGPGQGGAMHMDLTSLISNMMGVNPSQQPRPASSSSGTSHPTNTSSNTTTTTSTAPSTAPSSGNPMGSTLADLFRHFTSQMGPSGDVDQSDPSFMHALIENVAPHVRLTDLFSLVMGNTGVVGQLRDPLRQFMQDRVNQFGSRENVVNAAVADMNSEIVFITSCVEVRSGVDMAQSVRNCLKFHMEKIINEILSETSVSPEVYGRDLYQLWMTMLAQAVALCIYCISNGQQGFSHMLQQYMPRMTRDLNPAITMWMSTSVQDILSSFHHNHPVPEADILPFVSPDSPPQVGVAQSTSTTMTGPSTHASTNPSAPSTQTSSTPPQTANTPTAVSSNAGSIPMDVSESPSSMPPRAKVLRTQCQAKDTDSGEEFVDAPEEFTSRPPVTPATRPTQIATSSQPKVELQNGEASSQWEGVIPQEWIPVIKQDVDRQKESRPQGPLSDVYLQGLPAKRRRMMVLDHAGEMGNMPQYLPSAIVRAAQAAGVEPISSQQNLMHEAGEEKELQEDLEQEVQTVVESRITTDTDFNSERFPNSLRYFQNPKKNP